MAIITSAAIKELFLHHVDTVGIYQIHIRNAFHVSEEADLLIMPITFTESTLPETLEKVVEIPLESLEEQGIVIVHCRFNGSGAIRIWQSTFLIDRGSNHRSKLLHVENISIYPVWTWLEGSGGLSFTLFFEALPKSCTLFDLHEVIPQPGGFFIEGIRRNDRDVYNVLIS